VSIKSITQFLLKLENTIIEDIKIDAKEQELHVFVRPKSRYRNRCGRCEKPAKYRDRGRGIRSWRHWDLGSTKVLLMAEAPRVYCHRCNAVTVAYVPWAHHKSRFTHVFEEEVAWFALYCTKKVISAYKRINWETVGDIIQRVQKRIQPFDVNERFAGVTKIGIDETSYKKGHKYLTLVVDHDTGRVIWVSDKHGKAVLEKLFEELSPETRVQITHVTADGARWIWETIDKYCPDAIHCIDPFHVVSWATEALDDVRRGEWRVAVEAAKNESKKGRGRPKEGSNYGELAKCANSIKGSRYCTLKNPENLTEKQAAQLELVATTSPLYYRAYELKELLRIVFMSKGVGEAKEDLDRWMKWAQRCRIPRFRELREKIKRHYCAILAAVEHGLSNARVEATNTKIKLICRMAYGFRNIENLISLIYLSTSNPKPTIPGRI
jgi:transposase